MNQGFFIFINHHIAESLLYQAMCVYNDINFQA
jgi:hypothetical protein